MCFNQFILTNFGWYILVVQRLYRTKTHPTVFDASYDILSLSLEQLYLKPSDFECRTIIFLDYKTCLVSPGTYSRYRYLPEPSHHATYASYYVSRQSSQTIRDKFALWSHRILGIENVVPIDCYFGRIIRLGGGSQILLLPPVHVNNNARVRYKPILCAKKNKSGK